MIFKECIILRISWLLNEIDDKLALCGDRSCYKRQSAIVWDWCTLECKKGIEMVCFSLKFDTSLLLIKIGGINGILFAL